MLAARRRSRQRTGLRHSRGSAGRESQTGTGRYITLGGIYTRNPDDGDRNIGMYRVQVFGPRKCAMHWHMHHDGARHFRMWTAARREDAAGDRARRRERHALRRHRPAAAGRRGTPLRRLPQRRRHRAGAVQHDRPGSPRQRRDRHRRLRRSERRSSSKAPSATTPASTRWPTGTPPSTSPRSRTASDPIYPTTIVGKPPMEDYFLGKATERIFLPLLKMLDPRHRRLLAADQRRVPQLRVRQDPEGIPVPGPAGDARDLGRGADGVHEVHRRRGRARERARRAGRAVPPLRNCDPRATPRSSTARSTSSTTHHSNTAGAAKSASTRRENCQVKDRFETGRGNWNSI